MDGPVKDVGSELVQAFADGYEKVDLIAPFGEGPAEPDLCVFRHGIHAPAQQRQLFRNGLGNALRFLRLFAGQQARAVPGAGCRRAAEAAELRGAAEPARELLAVPDVVQHAALEPDCRRRCRLDGGQLCKGLHGLIRRATPARPYVVQGGYVVHEGVAVPGQCGVQVAQLRLKRLLVADDRPDQLALQLQRAGAACQLQEDRIQAEAIQLPGDLGEAGPPVTNHQDGLALVHQGADGVDDGLGLARARRAADHQRVARPDGVDHILLVRVGVEQQKLVCGVTVVRAGEAAGFQRRHVDQFAGTGPSQRGDQGVVLVDPRIIEVAGEVGEGGDEQVVFDLRAVNRLDQGAQAVQNGLRVVTCRAVRHPRHRVDVENDPVDGLEVPDQRRVDLCLFGELQLVVVLAGAHRKGDGGEHDRGRDPLRFAADGGGPDDRAGGEIPRVDAAVIGEFENLGAQVARCPGRDNELLAVADQGREPGTPPCHQLGEPRGMGMSQVN